MSNKRLPVSCQPGNIGRKQGIFNATPGLWHPAIGRICRAATRKMPAQARSLSALVWLANAKTSGFDLDHHNVFFSDDYEAEFRDIKAGRPPANPTAYVCALDRGQTAVAANQAERLQIIINAPANGDTEQYASRGEMHTDLLARWPRADWTEDPLPNRW